MMTAGVGWKPSLKSVNAVKTGYKFNEAKPWMPFLIDVQVELYGTNPCVNPTMHPKVPDIHYALLNQLGTGCGLFGKEDKLTELV